jgi:heme/copper-type cytochrome/quinol oxidase subunit 4
MNENEKPAYQDPAFWATVFVVGLVIGVVLWLLGSVQVFAL